MLFQSELSSFYSIYYSLRLLKRAFIAATLSNLACFSSSRCFPTCGYCYYLYELGSYSRLRLRFLEVAFRPPCIDKIVSSTGSVLLTSFVYCYFCLSSFSFSCIILLKSGLDLTLIATCGYGFST
jgi:hypothetical protein